MENGCYPYGSVISQPTLRAALKDGGTISGRFSQREINQLAADLKAGIVEFHTKNLVDRRKRQSRTWS